MHAKPDLRVFLNWMIAGSGSVITADIPLEQITTHGAKVEVNVWDSYSAFSLCRGCPSLRSCPNPFPVTSHQRGLCPTR